MHGFTSRAARRRPLPAGRLAAALATTAAAAALLAAPAPCGKVAIAAPAAPGSIAYVDLEGDLHVVDPDGGEHEPLRADEVFRSVSWGGPAVAAAAEAVYRWPAWSPDARKLFAFRALAKEDELVDGLYVFEAASHRVLGVYEATGLNPIYTHWSPQGDRAAVLFRTSEGFSLDLWPNPSGDRPHRLGSGVPFFSAWSGDGRSILVHAGNDDASPTGQVVALVDVASGKQSVLSREPAIFGPASWSSDGAHVAWANLAPAGGSQVVVGGPRGEKAAPILAVPSERLALLWSPAAPVLAVAAAAPAAPRPFVRLRFVAPDGQPAPGFAPLTDDFHAFFWSPDGSRILYARATEDGELEWAVHDPRSGDQKVLLPFVPSPQLRMVLRFFDQYALSHRVFSPDGRRFTFPGVAGSDLERPGPWRIYVADATGEAPPRVLAPGHTSFWSPR